MAAGALGVFLVAAAHVHAQAAAPPDPHATVKAELREFFRELNAAAAKRDRAALERLYADEFTWVHATGGIVERAAQIDEVVSMDPFRPIPEPSFDGLQVYGDVALLKRAQAGRYDTALYAKRGGRWQLVLLQGTFLQPERTAVKVDVAVLDQYVGRYRQTNGVLVTFAREGDTLSLQAPGWPKRPLTATSQSRFFDRLGTEVVFAKDETGQMGYRLRLRDGKEVNATRVP